MRAVLPLIDSTRVHWLVGNVQIPATVVDQLVFRRLATGDLEMPNLLTQTPEASAKPLYDWYEDFVIKGNNTEDREKSIQLDYFAKGSTTVLFRLTVSNTGILKLAPAKLEPNAPVRLMQAEQYMDPAKGKAILQHAIR
ncbi:MAG: hypothetical protein IT162_00875 [Bryobacterales bacterium]|nr:hypothetical protein [Bryobacterales bacterium]